MKVGLTVIEALSAKTKAQDTILESIRRFCDETGLAVDGVDLVRIENIGGNKTVLAVKLDVRL